MAARLLHLRLPPHSGPDAQPLPYHCRAALTVCLLFTCAGSDTGGGGGGVVGGGAGGCPAAGHGRVRAAAGGGAGGIDRGGGRTVTLCAVRGVCCVWGGGVGCKWVQEGAGVERVCLVGVSFREVCHL